MYTLFLSTWGVTSLMMLVTWGVYVFLGNPGVVDVSWAFSIMAVGCFLYYKYSPDSPLQLILLILLVLWAVRLGGFLLWTRIFSAYLDDRYTDISKSFSQLEALNFFLNYQLQAFLAACVASCLVMVFVSDLPRYPMIVWFGVVLIGLGIIGETIADYQLYVFKQESTGQLYQGGLWAYSRHPNYFFEILVWSGFAISGVGVSGNYFSVISPLALWAIMHYLTIPITERVSLKKRPLEYKKYMQEIPEIFPFRFYR